MKSVLLFLVVVVLSGQAIAQQAGSSAPQYSYKPAVGSTAPMQSHEEPAMYPAAKASHEAKDRAAQTASPTSSAGSQDAVSNLAWGILLFMFLALCIEAYVVVKAQRPWSPQSILRAFGITLIVPLAVFLVVAGYSENQIAPVIGLLGVVAGYLLGNNDKPRQSA